ncbi:phosphatase PAP2 family protein [Marinomonas pollencensis]|uniref:undecaprenyl-diphosphate phosphatase n=1 Tax=Marinomonas pollencensis TaxID=491954 RepID=A0A3E0DKY9_9GAMM|nr:phosphatase PAP2 family protein [Marinomonas pollencensis]REG82196.1 undecaprenyl-diphosphatase [Marinomonas pollencensis]
MNNDLFLESKVTRSNLVLLSVLFFGFVLLATLVHTPIVAHIDSSLLFALRDSHDVRQGWGPDWVGSLMRDITALGSNWLLGFFSLVLAGYLALIGKGRLALYFLIVIASGMVFSFLLKWGFSRPRPELVPHATKVYTSSFPSGHAMSSALFFLSCALLPDWQYPKRSAARWWLGVAVLIPLCVALSRVYLGVHWPTDVIAGLCAGFFWALLCFVLAKPHLERC